MFSFPTIQTNFEIVLKKNAPSHILLFMDLVAACLGWVIDYILLNRILIEEKTVLSRGCVKAMATFMYRYRYNWPLQDNRV
jgi:hypothetical protein